MTRRSKREIERAIQELRHRDDDSDDVDVMASVTTITEDMVDDEGAVEIPERDAPEGYDLGPELDTESQIVTCHAVAPSADIDGDDPADTKRQA